eukprot:COSAG01_NODE_30964_length_606_cov_1.007890_1_plen_171_part_10
MPEAEKIVFTWAFVFDMPPETIPEEEINDDDMEEAYNLDGTPRRDKNADRNLPVPHEAWVAAEKICACDLTFEYVLPIDGKHLILAVGARHDVMVDEAHAMEVLMRMQETKGQLEFHPDLKRYYNSNHGGLTEWADGKWNRRSLDAVADHWQTDEKLSDMHVMQRREDEKK